MPVVSHAQWFVSVTSEIAAKAHAFMMRDMGRNPVALAYKPRCMEVCFAPTWENGAAASPPDGFVSVAMFPSNLTVDQLSAWVRTQLQDAPLF